MSLSPVSSSKVSVTPPGCTLVEPRPTQFGPSQDQTKTHFFPSRGRQGYTTGYKRRIKAYQDQVNRKEWYHQHPQGPWVNAPHLWYYTQPDPRLWLNKQPSSSMTLQ